MSRRHWTILVLSDDQGPVRQFRFSRELVRTTIGAALLGVAVLTSVGASVVVRQSDDQRVRRLTRENALLREEVQEMRDRSTSLSSALDQLAEQDQAFRLVAGLDPLHEDVLQAGVGGPGTSTAEDGELFQLDAALGRNTFSAAEEIETLLRRAELLASSWSEARETLAEHHNRLAATPSILPARGFLTSQFSRSRMHPILHVARPHEGIDVTAPEGTPILAAADGTVAFVGYNGDYGLMVELDHGHGYITRYAHASRTQVKAGEKVRRGDTIAAVGSTGLAVGPHVHYEVIVDGRPKDPRRFILQGTALPD